MASMLSDQIKCAICFEDFKNPVSLPCDHTYCKQCVTAYIRRTGPGLCLCPECRRPFQREDLRDCRLLENITRAARDTLEAGRPQRSSDRRTREEATGVVNALLCPEHQEKLKLFCMTDEKLVCIVCRDSDRHQRHHFTPVTEAAVIYKEELKASLDFVYTERNELCDLKLKQTDEIRKTKDKSKGQHDQITAQFAMIYEFLRQRERVAREQVDRQERSALEPLQRNEAAIAGRLRETERLEESLESGLDMANPDAFLQWWSDKGLYQVQEMKHKGDETKRSMYKSRTAGLKVLLDRFTLGPYESYTPIFIWREMLRCLTQALDVFVRVYPNMNLFLSCNAGQQAISQAVFTRPKKLDGGYWEDCMESLQTGQRYWEVDVGQEANWQLGLRVKAHPQCGATSTWGEVWSEVWSSLVSAPKPREVALLLKNNVVFVLRETGEEVQVDLPDRPWRIGVYLDCDRRQVTFCNADNTSVIYTVWCSP
ncbi:nuclear factor 7, brain-like [Alosa sapidissima]|uniref:nuclear factor 7, brain-like n=1 Tax=Alosa sapidissima TaxID=34773 RepID=UPI001C082AE7|nr:nuclear factor 7, brain-like [Alosa sapidissima]